MIVKSAYASPRTGNAGRVLDTIRGLAERLRQSQWRPISTAPCNQVLELRIGDFGSPRTLEFPCLKTNTGAWINVDLGSEIKIQPLEWRIWQRSRSPQPHRCRISPKDRSVRFRRSFAIGYEAA
jgi:hypothetical protein